METNKTTNESPLLPASEAIVATATKEARGITNSIIIIRQLLFDAGNNFFKSKISPIEFGWKLHEIFATLKEVENNSDKLFAYLNQFARAQKKD